MKRSICINIANLATADSYMLNKHSVPRCRHKKSITSKLLMLIRQKNRLLGRYTHKKRSPKTAALIPEQFNDEILLAIQIFVIPLFINQIFICNRFRTNSTIYGFGNNSCTNPTAYRISYTLLTVIPSGFPSTIFTRRVPPFISK